MIFLEKMETPKKLSDNPQKNLELIASNPDQIAVLRESANIFGQIYEVGNPKTLNRIKGEFLSEIQANGYSPCCFRNGIKWAESTGNLEALKEFLGDKNDFKQILNCNFAYRAAQKDFAGTGDILEGMQILGQGELVKSIIDLYLPKFFGNLKSPNNFCKIFEEGVKFIQFLVAVEETPEIKEQIKNFLSNAENRKYINNYLQSGTNEVWAGNFLNFAQVLQALKLTDIFADEVRESLSRVPKTFFPTAGDDILWRNLTESFSIFGFNIPEQRVKKDIPHFLAQTQNLIQQKKGETAARVLEFVAQFEPQMAAEFLQNHQSQIRDLFAELAGGIEDAKHYYPPQKIYFWRDISALLRLGKIYPELLDPQTVRENLKVLMQKTDDPAHKFLGSIEMYLPGFELLQQLPVQERAPALQMIETRFQAAKSTEAIVDKTQTSAGAATKA